MTTGDPKDAACRAALAGAAWAGPYRLVEVARVWADRAIMHDAGAVDASAAFSRAASAVMPASEGSTYEFLVAACRRGAT